MSDLVIKKRPRFDNMRIWVAISVIFYILPLLTSAYVFADDLTRYQKIVRDEAIYPRDCRYLLPATLHKNGTELMDIANLKIASELEKMGVLKISTQGSLVKISASENTSDIVQQNYNMSYELQGLALILGVWDVEIISENKAGSNTVLSGIKIIKKKTRLYEPVLHLLSLEERKKYATIPAKWELTRNNGQVNITEILSE